MDHNLEKPLRREKQEWANEKPKQDNAGRLRGIDFIDPEDGEYEETIKKRKEKVGSSSGGGNALQKRKKKHSWLQETEAKSCESNKIPKTKLACIVQAHESTRQLLNHLYRKIMKITSQAKDIIR